MVRILLYVSIFLSAALLFLIQPLFAKYLVPHFGGTSAVWIISISFYSTILLLGYLYAAFVTSLPLRTGRLLHTGLLTLTGALLIVRWVSNGTPVGVISFGDISPALATVLTLFYSVGLPVVFLASTSVIVQHLFARYTNEDPYWLYALSNAGSLIGLAVFPFFLEPLVGLPFQFGMWTVLFVVYLIALLAVWRQVEVQQQDAGEKASEFRPLARPLRILVYAAIPTFLLASFTELFSRGIASFPLLWVIPLMLYLITFIVTFREWSSARLLPIGFIALISTLPGFLLLPSMNDNASTFWIVFVLMMVAFFLMTCYFHRSIYLWRPDSSRLGSFYVWLTIGGAIGSGIVSIVLPIISQVDTEAYFGFALVTLYLLYTQSGWIADAVHKNVLLSFRVLFFLMILTFVGLTTISKGLIESERNFYGTIKIYDQQVLMEDELIDVRFMAHGITNHGLEALDERYSDKAVSYYGPGSGIELSLRSFRETGAKPNVSVIGLGAGMMNTYCDEVSSLEYVEINPLVYDLAKEYFSYLDTCQEKVTVDIADGRIALEERLQPDLDIIMIDAFSDDAIPVHLLTREAFTNAYVPNLSENGVVVVHISNRYLNLYPAVAGMVEDTEFVAIAVENESDTENPLSMTTSWVILARPEQAERFVEYDSAGYYTDRTIQWVDARSSILEVLSFRGSFVMDK